VKGTTAKLDLEKKASDLATDLRTRGCAVCDEVIRTARDFFAQWQYALASESESQSFFAAELGFCPPHFWQLHSMSSPWGESIGLARLTEHVSCLLAKLEHGSRATSDFRNLLRTSKNCRVCRMLDEAEIAYIKRLGSFVEDENGRQVYERSQGTCLRHLALLLGVSSDVTREFLLATASRRLQKTAEEMHNYAAKREANRRDLISSDERDAYMRALVHFVSAKDYATPRPDDREV
jgi:hypothetical protein